MEIEVKYQLPSEEILEEIWNSEEIWGISEPDSSETVPMQAVYYDTANKLLNRAGIVMRVRKEGDSAFCTIKWNGKIVMGIHEREEINIPLSANEAEIIPDASVLKRCSKGREITGLIEDSALISFLKMDFTRRRRKLIYDNNLMELALDCGTISAAGKNCSILEMELEHCSGNDSLAVLELGEIIADRYGLTLQTKSKFSRGLELLKRG